MSVNEPVKFSARLPLASRASTVRLKLAPATTLLATAVPLMAETKTVEKVTLKAVVCTPAPAAPVAGFGFVVVAVIR